MKKLLLLVPLFLLSACTSETFHGYECKDDCSGHKAGYEWAKNNDIDTQNNCLSHSQSFQEGCFVYVEQNGGNTISLTNTPSNTTNKKEVIVKYRKQNPVDVSSFESVHPNESTVKSVYYDSSNNHLIINLRGVHYHYCQFNNKTWEKLRYSSSVDSFYKNSIKGNFDCRNGGVPEY